VGGKEWPETGTGGVTGSVESLSEYGHLGSGELIVKPTFVGSVLCF